MAAIDINPQCVETHRRNLQSPAIQADLTLGLPESVKRAKVGLFFAGSPCQGFSTLGKGDVADPRNSLFIQAARLAVQCRPKVIMLENVAGILSNRFIKFHSEVITMFRDSGYQVHSLVAEASDFGLPQIRRRSITVAWNTGKVHDPAIIASKRVYRLGEFLSGLHTGSDYRNDTLPLSALDLSIARLIPPGRRLTNSRRGDSVVHTWELPSVFSATSARERHLLSVLSSLRRRERKRSWGDADAVSPARLSAELGYDCAKDVKALMGKGYIRRRGKNVDLTHTFNGKYRRISKAELLPAVDTRFGQARSFLHPTRVGGFSVREAASLQGFPPSFSFAGELRQQFQMIGNAVPVTVAEALGALTRRLL